jgi:hypothetical protein
MHIHHKAEEYSRSKTGDLRELNLIREAVEVGYEIGISDRESSKVRLVLTQTINKSIFQIMSLTIASNQKSLGTLVLVDEVTSQPVTGSFTGTTATSDSDSFTASVDSNGNVVVAGVLAGNGNVTVATTATYTDSTNTAQTQTLTVVVPVIITAVVTADAVGLEVNFGVPQAQ